MNFLNPMYLLSHRVMNVNSVHLLHLLANLFQFPLEDVLIKTIFVFRKSHVLQHHWSFATPLNVHHHIWLIELVISPESLRRNAVLVLVKALMMGRDVQGIIIGMSI